MILYKELSYKIIGLAMEVHTRLGYGFLEKVYENAMMVLLEREGLPAKQQVPTPVYFEGKNIGDYCADILVDDRLILELKSVEEIALIHRAQTLNYLKATGLKLGLIINFGKRKLDYERMVL